MRKWSALTDNYSDMPLDPTGRYKGNNFDPNYAAKRKAKQQLDQRHGKVDNDHRSRDFGYDSQRERDGRGWQGPSSLDYSDHGPQQNSNNFTPQRGTHWTSSGDRPSSQGYRYNDYSTPRQELSPRQNLFTHSFNNYSRPTARISTPPLVSVQTDLRDVSASSRDQNSKAAFQGLTHIPANGDSAPCAPLDTSVGLGGEFSSLEKLKLFKAQVEASRVVGSADASSTAVTRVAESFLQRENSNHANDAEEGEVEDSNSAHANVKAQALKAKLKALQQKRAGPHAAPVTSIDPTAAPAPEPGAKQSTPAVSNKNKAVDTASIIATDQAKSASEPSDIAAKERESSQRSSVQQLSQSNRQAQSYADSGPARDHTRRRSMSPRGRAASPVRYNSRPKEQLERRFSVPNDHFADQPSYSGLRTRRNDMTRYDRPLPSRETSTVRPTRATGPPATPTSVSSTSINLVVKTLEVIKAQVEQLEILIQPMLNAQVDSENSQNPARGPPQSPVKEPALLPGSSFSHQRRPSYDSYELTAPSAYHKRKLSYEDDGDGGYYRSTPTRGGFKRVRGGWGRGGKTYNHKDSRDPRDARDTRN